MVCIVNFIGEDMLIVDFYEVIINFSIVFYIKCKYGWGKSVNYF